MRQFHQFIKINNKYRVSELQINLPFQADLQDGHLQN